MSNQTTPLLANESTSASKIDAEKTARYEPQSKVGRFFWRTRWLWIVLFVIGIVAIVGIFAIVPAVVAGIIKNGAENLEIYLDSMEMVTINANGKIDVHIRGSIQFPTPSQGYVDLSPTVYDLYVTSTSGETGILGRLDFPALRPKAGKADYDVDTVLRVSEDKYFDIFVTELLKNETIVINLVGPSTTTVDLPLYNWNITATHIVHVPITMVGIGGLEMTVDELEIGDVEDDSYDIPVNINFTSDNNSTVFANFNLPLYAVDLIAYYDNAILGYLTIDSIGLAKPSSPNFATLVIVGNCTDASIDYVSGFITAVRTGKPTEVHIEGTLKPDINLPRTAADPAELVIDVVLNRPEEKIKPFALALPARSSLRDECDNSAKWSAPIRRPSRASRHARPVV